MSWTAADLPSFAGRSVIVTGANSGLGLVTARELARVGARVILACRDIDRGDAAASSMSGDVQVRRLDLQSLASVRDFADSVAVVDVLINNAGITKDARLAKMTSAQFDSVIAVNLKGVFECTQAVADTMVAQGSGSIVNASSVVGLYGNFGQTNYAATKAGVIGFTKTWARELGPKGVRVNAVCPGFVKTPILETIPEEVMQKMVAKVPLGRLGQPEEIAAVYAFLASDDSSYLNGAVIEVSGGIQL